jgi:hypothetical protein
VSNSWIDPPPPQKGMGCFAKGCLILIVFLIFLGLGIIGGTIYGVRYLRHNYFPTANVQLPANRSTTQEQELARQKWSSFEQAARAHTPARIEMTADELNALIAAEPKLRDKAYVTIDNDVAHLRVSVPLDEVSWLKGHYINGECTVQSSVSGNPAGARITGVVINGHAVSDDALNLQYPPWSLRRYLSNWAETNNLKTFEIRDGKVILEGKGDL